MPSLIVVDDAGDWPLAVPGVQLVAARDYLTDSGYTDLRRTHVFNLCRSYRYQSTGYYVSLLAAARGHRPLPSVTTLQDLKSPTIVRTISGELDELIQKSLAPLQGREFVLSVYFGHNLAKRYDRLSRQLFGLFRAPFLRAQFVHGDKDGRWRLQTLGLITAGEIPADHLPFVMETARDYFAGRGSRGGRRRSASRYDLAILVAPEEAEPPSNVRALKKFQRAAESLGLSVELIGREDFGRLAEFDALFIRETTGVNHHTYRFARRAAAEGLVVIDDPESVLKCTNKVFLAELLERRRVAMPRTVVVHRGNRDALAQRLGFPCILKQPDSSFSRGVVKVEDKTQLKEALGRLFEKSELLIAQEFLPTPFDWRIGVLDGQPLFACKYFMAKAHWQILRHDDDGRKCDEGTFETLPVEEVPPPVLRTALKAAGLIGNGLYGVDLKAIGRRVYVIEINDNPNIDAGVEDRVLKDELYLRVMRVFLQRIEEGKRAR